MAVYVDNAMLPLGRMIMCHMIADTHEELMEMAQRIGVERHHLQKAGTHQEHFDVCLRMRARAVWNGAKEITQKELGAKLLERIVDGRGEQLRGEGWTLCYVVEASAE